MEHLPFWVSGLFLAVTLSTLYMFYKAGKLGWPALLIIFVWLALQALLAYSGFYLVSQTLPPRFGLALMPPVVLTLVSLAFKQGRAFFDRFDLGALTWLHVIRIPVEIVLYGLYLYKLIPEIMTFEGTNLDILSGITAGLVFFFVFVHPVLSKKFLLVWNIVCLGLLLNIVITAIFCAPTPFQKLGFGLPHVAIFYFPFVWLPSFVVPVVFFSHVAAIRLLLKTR